LGSGVTAVALWTFLALQATAFAYAMSVAGRGGGGGANPRRKFLNFLLLGSFQRPGHLHPDHHRFDQPTRFRRCVSRSGVWHRVRLLLGGVHGRGTGGLWGFAGRLRAGTWQRPDVGCQQARCGFYAPPRPRIGPKTLGKQHEGDGHTAAALDCSR